MQSTSGSGRCVGQTNPRTGIALKFLKWSNILNVIGDAELELSGLSETRVVSSSLELNEH